MINKVTLIGNLGSDPEVRHLESGAVVAKFSLATNESYKDKAGEWQTQTEWHNVIMWRNLAERAERDLKKGKLVFVEGKLTHRKYEKEGQTRYITEVVANTYRLLEKRENTGGNYNNSFPNSEPATKTVESNAASKTPAKEASTTGEAEDDLPF